MSERSLPVVWKQPFGEGWAPHRALREGRTWLPFALPMFHSITLSQKVMWLVFFLMEGCYLPQSLTFVSVCCYFFSWSNHRSHSDRYGKPRCVGNRGQSSRRGARSGWWRHHSRWAPPRWIFFWHTRYRAERMQRFVQFFLTFHEKMQYGGCSRRSTCC